jgi:hypothetical protein
MKSFQRYLDVVVAIISFGLLISLWPYRDAVVRDAYATTTTDLGLHKSTSLAFIISKPTIKMYDFVGGDNTSNSRLI